MYKKSIAITSILGILLLVATPAGAITYGELDRNGHPYVGLTLTDLGGDELWPGCSGTLIAPTVFLTAGHCTSGLSRFGAEKTWITFDSEYIPGKSDLIAIKAFVTHPDYDPHTLFNDVGVILLDESVENVTPGMLPTENLLDQMKAAGTLKNQTFVIVGYGATADFKGHPPALLPRDGVRRFSTPPYSSLTQNWLHLLGNNDSTGAGNICIGDSGAPHFLGDSNVIVSIGSSVDAICRSLDMSQRVDTPSVLAFLDDYVTLP